MNVVVIDSQHLPDDVEFPPLAAYKFGWQQFLGLDRADIKERCWRSHCVVTFNTFLDKELLNSMAKLELLILANHDAKLVDIQAAEKNNVSVCQIPDLDPAQFDLNNQTQAQHLCDTIVKLIDRYMEQTP
ncbi:hypothetical protein JYT31_01525 [Beggiatoa alba]|nr:hypothetical protein [Beggiatoa alba]